MQRLYHGKYHEKVLHNYFICDNYELEIFMSREGVARVNYHAIEIESDNLDKRVNLEN